MNLLRSEIHEMWTLVYKQIFRAGEAVLTLNKDTAQQVLISERRVNVYELKIDSDVEDILAIYNPVAIDLRFVLAVSKINTNLERIGDFAEGIARFVMNYPEPALDADLIKHVRLADMIDEVKSMLQKTQEAFEKENTDLASSIFAHDNFVDEINNEAPAILADYIKNNPDTALSCLNLIGVIRKLERTGDHINNIAEEIIFYVDAKVLKHSTGNNSTEE
jgi:phosphate transport system protein